MEIAFENPVAFSRMETRTSHTRRSPASPGRSIGSSSTPGVPSREAAPSATSLRAWATATSFADVPSVNAPLA